MKIEKSNLKYHILFAVLLLFQTLLMVGKCFLVGNSIGGDEFFSYGLANNTEEYIFWDLNQVAAHEDENGWFRGSDIQHYLEVEKGEQFAFDRVFWNQKTDVHPPLYYIFLNSVCSLFPETFSVWYAYSINIIIFMLAGIILYRIGWSLFHDYKAIIPCIVYGFCNGAQLLTTYKRMYALLGLFCLLLFYSHVKFVLEGKLQKKTLALLVLAVVGGGLTHYYFYVYACCLGAFFALYILWQKKVRDFWKYVVTCCIGGVINLVIFPPVVKHTLFSYRGEEVRDNLFNQTWFAEKYIQGLISAILNNRWKFFVVIIAFIVIAGIIALCNKKMTWDKEKQKKNPVVVLACINFASILLYAVIIMKTSIYGKWYYISPIYAMICIEIVLLLMKVSTFIHQKFSYIITTMLIVLFAMSVPSEMNAIYQKWQLAKARNVVGSEEDYNNRDCLFIYKEWNNLFDNQMLALCQYDEIRCIDINNLSDENIEAVLLSRDTKGKIDIYAPSGEEIIDIIDDKNMLKLEKVYEGGVNDIYMQK